MAPVASPSNPYKRHIDAVQRVYDCTKRLKARHDSNSATSNVSDDSALIPTSVPEDTTEASEVESDASSEVSESSDEPSDESSEEEDDDDSELEEDENEDEDEHAQQSGEEVVNLRANRGNKPKFKIADDVEDIRPFLKDFLPKLKAANEELEAQKKAGRIQSSEVAGEENEDNEEQYIEMNLGLGVLEEKDDNMDGREASDSESESKDGDQSNEKDILGKLMGRDKLEERVGIQEVSDMKEDPLTK
ncbi:hypothetical protein N0V90_010678 [Kalmusia sp. IMI 367209]|nr:hypothetical protein N0V90_010678 [Kalmusia sp. IMI 367209]